MNRNRLQEIEALKQLANQSDDVDAQIKLARKYAIGLTVERDLNEAGYWYYMALRFRHIGEGNIFAPEPERDKALRELSGIRDLVESEPLIIHDNILIRCHAKQKTVVIPTGVRIIGKKAFYWEHAVEEVILPAGVVEIQDFAFSAKVKHIIIPYGVKKLGRGAFESSEIEDLVLPEGISDIPSCAFGFGLRSITIPSSVTKIGNMAFNLCSKLRTINYQGSKEQWKAIELGKYNTILRFAKKNYNYSYRGLIGQKNQAGNAPKDAVLPQTEPSTLHHAVLNAPKRPDISMEEMRKQLVSYCGGRSCSKCLVSAAVPNHRCGRGVGIMTKKPDESYDISDDEIRSLYRAVFLEGDINTPNSGHSAGAHESITTSTSQKPAVSSQQANLEKEEIRQTLTSCLKCGKAIATATCGYCRYNNASCDVKLLCQIESLYL